MSPRDFVLTANWMTHDHGNTSNQPMIWLDVLDLPTVNFFESMFAEHLDEHRQTVRRQDGDSAAFFASGVLPDGAEVGALLSGKLSPVVNYTYARTRPILERLCKAGEVDRRHGARVRYVNPANGGWRCPQWGRSLRCCRRALRASAIAPPTGPFSCVSRARAQLASATRNSRGLQATSSLRRHGSIIRTQRGRTRCCSRSPTAPPRRRSASGRRASRAWCGTRIEPSEMPDRSRPRSRWPDFRCAIRAAAMTVNRPHRFLL